MPQDDTQPVLPEHSAWCNQYDNHDPHRSTPERVDRDFPSDLVIAAYLLRLNRNPTTLAALEFSQPGEETVQHLLTLGQLRHLGEALTRLVSTEEGSWPAGRNCRDQD